jgi:hypothetical protein
MPARTDPETGKQVGDLVGVDHPRMRGVAVKVMKVNDTTLGCARVDADGNVTGNTFRVSKALVIEAPTVAKPGEPETIGVPYQPPSDLREGEIVSWATAPAKAFATRALTGPDLFVVLANKHTGQSGRINVAVLGGDTRGSYWKVAPRALARVSMKDLAEALSAGA